MGCLVACRGVPHARPRVRRHGVASLWSGVPIPRCSFRVLDLGGSSPLVPVVPERQLMAAPLSGLSTTNLVGGPFFRSR